MVVDWDLVESLDPNEVDEVVAKKTQRSVFQIICKKHRETNKLKYPPSNDDCYRCEVVRTCPFVRSNKMCEMEKLYSTLLFEEKNGKTVPVFSKYGTEREYRGNMVFSDKFRKPPGIKRRQIRKCVNGKMVRVREELI